MAVYCADLQSHATDLVSPSGSYEVMGSVQALCVRSWVVITRPEFDQLVSAGSGVSSPQFTAGEVSALKFMAANPSPFNLSVEDGYLVSGAIVGVWVVAWAFRALYLTLRSDGEPNE